MNDKKVLTTDEICEIFKAHREWRETEGDSGKRADFAEMDLRGIDWKKYTFKGARLQWADLRHGEFVDVGYWGDDEIIPFDMGEADLRGANMSGLDLYHVILDSTDLRGANLRYATFFESNVICANFSCADLSGAKFDETNARKVDFRGANLTGAIFRDVDLEDADFKGAIMDGVSFERCNLEYARFDSAMFMKGCSLKYAHFDISDNE